MAARARLRAGVRVPPRARAMNLRRWLTPGIGVKRWLLVAFVGLLLIAVGVAHVLRQVTADLNPSDTLANVIDVVTLQWLPYQLRGLIAGALGVTLFVYGAYRLIRALVDPFEAWDGEQPMVEVIYQKRFLARGPRVVAIGGGTGLSTLLRGLKEHTSNLTAVVTVADDGGSSGVLRTQLGIPAVGDIRNCIVALADAEPLMGRLLQYRFPGASPAVDAPDRSVAAPLRPGLARPGDAAGGPRRPRRRQPAARGPGAARAGRLRGGGARDEPRARGARPGRAGDGHRDHAVRAARRRHPGHRPEPDRQDQPGRPRVGHARGRPPDGRRAPGHRRRRAHRHRPGQPVHEPPARSRGARDPRGDRGVRRAGRVRVQRGHAARRDRRVRPRGPHRRARSPRRGPPAGHRARQQPVRRARPERAGWASP